MSENKNNTFFPANEQDTGTAERCRYFCGSVYAIATEVPFCRVTGSPAIQAGASSFSEFLSITVMDSGVSVIA